jgi:hypothetical protein
VLRKPCGVKNQARHDGLLAEGSGVVANWWPSWPGCSAPVFSISPSPGPSQDRLNRPPRLRRRLTLGAKVLQALATPGWGRAAPGGVCPGNRLKMRVIDSAEIGAGWHRNCTGAPSAETWVLGWTAPNPPKRPAIQCRAHTLRKPRTLMREKAGRGHMRF